MNGTTSREHEILCQMLIAFGQGLGYVRVPRTTSTRIHNQFLKFLRYDHCQKRLNGKEDVWGQPDHGAQVLERVRAAGKLAGQRAVEAGRTKIDDTDFEQALKEVQAAQDCDWCQIQPIDPFPTQK